MSGSVRTVSSKRSGFYRKLMGLVLTFLTNEPVLIEYGVVYLRAVSLSYALVGISQESLPMMI